MEFFLFKVGNFNLKVKKISFKVRNSAIKVGKSRNSNLKVGILKKKKFTTWHQYASVIHTVFGNDLNLLARRGILGLWDGSSGLLNKTFFCSIASHGTVKKNRLTMNWQLQMRNSFRYSLYLNVVLSVRKFYTFSTSPEPLGQFWPNLAQNILRQRGFKGPCPF